MKIVVFGATGPTGQQLLEQAVLMGHSVTAVARNPAAVVLNHPNLQVVQGDVFQPASLERAIAGQEAVLSSIGSREFPALKPIILYSTGITKIIEAMRHNDVRRLICVSSGGVIDEPAEQWWYRYLLKPMLTELYNDMRRMETIVEQSQLDWVMVRPTYLSKGPLTNKYRIDLLHTPPKGWKISRADLAQFMLRQLTSDEYLHTTPTLAY